MDNTETMQVIEQSVWREDDDYGKDFKSHYSWETRKEQKRNKN